MAQQQRLNIPAILFVLCLMLGELTSQQCGTEHYSVYQAMLKGHTFKRLQVRPNSIDCRQACMGDVRCQSYNYVIDEHICELNNRTRETRPEHFVEDHDRYYMTKGPKRVPLGSIPELPSDTCTEIKASEGGQAASGHYWLDTTKSGIPILAECDMKTEIADYCIMHHCLNNANCVNHHVNYTCECKTGWTGKYCGQDINECKVGHGCHSNATCMNTKGSYRCFCKRGFFGDGKNSCRDINECKVGHGCHSNATCMNTKGSYSCFCKRGFFGDGKNSCRDINECKVGHGCHSNARCMNTKGSYSCFCKRGFFGDGKNSCRDVNECMDPNSCPVQSSCINSLGSYRCVCSKGWRNFDSHTCLDVDECYTGLHSCPYNSRCTNTRGSYRCNCLSGWRNQAPRSCVDVDECRAGSHRCSSYNSQCVNTAGSYRCNCLSGWRNNGYYSCVDINECSNGWYSCPANSHCVNTQGSYRCDCNRCFYKSGSSCNNDCRLGTRYYYTTTYTSYKTYYYTSCGVIGLGRCRKSRTKWKTRRVRVSRQVWIANRSGASCPCS